MIDSQFTNAKKNTHVKMKVSDAEAENRAWSSEEMSADSGTKNINSFGQWLIGKLHCLIKDEVMSKIQMPHKKHIFLSHIVIPKTGRG